ncbi:hypothetical protein NIES23_61080 (plasmid) [Trichormus variabilis NIES-23]|uniref:Uncharacterized protein n=1 Tax=Trichormus variabilis NIES-23 TaxID=1973479 RepID=A0A1Z4KW76_ANAVA|nr:hypothetical protein NIES23_61080 [Trichormus variabilis NIES-23]
MNTIQQRDYQRTDETHRHNFVIAVSSLLDEYGLDPMEYRLYSHIVRRAGKEGCFESIPNMARICLMNEKTVRKALRVLIAAGLIQIAQQRQGKTTIYKITQSSEWVYSQQLNSIRQRVSATKVGQDLTQLDLTPTNSGTTNNDSPVKSGRGSSTSSGKGGSTNSGRGVVPNLADEVFPIKEIPIKQSQLKKDPQTPTDLGCVCEEIPVSNSVNHNEQTEQFNPPDQHKQLDQANPKSLTTLLNQPESLPQTDNLSSRPSIAARSFDKNELSNEDPYKSAQNVKELIEAWITDPTTFASDCVPVLVREKIKWSRWVLPWRSTQRKLHPHYQNFNPIVVDLVAVELASSASCTKDEKITHAVSVMNTWEKTKGGWTNLMQRYQQALDQQQRHTLPTTPNPTAKANISLAQAIAQDEQRRQQEQTKQTPSALPQHTSETLNIKEKLFSLANAQKARPSSTLSAAALLEVEAQLKQALGA